MKHPIKKTTSRKPKTVKNGKMGRKMGQTYLFVAIQSTSPMLLLRCTEQSQQDHLSPATPILINSPPPSPTHLRIANAPNHRHTRPALPPLLRRPDDGLDVVLHQRRASQANPPKPHRFVAIYKQAACTACQGHYRYYAWGFLERSRPHAR